MQDKSCPGTIRPLAASDLERVVEIDKQLSGAPRKGFYERRLKSSLAHKDAFVSLGYVEDGRLEGFVMAQIIDGEFGSDHPIGILDALGTTATVRGHGGAHALLAELERELGKRGVGELRSQTTWSNMALTHFLAGSGFDLAPSIVLDRACARMANEVAPGESNDDGTEDLSRDRVPVRTLQASDLGAVVTIDKRITGQDRAAYYGRKFDEVLNESGIRLSMLASADDTAAGFIMARVDYGEFGQTEAEAVLDTIGVDPDFRGRDVGEALLTVLLGNLETLRVERVRTEVPWNNYGLLAFLEARGFRPSQRVNFIKAL